MQPLSLFGHNPLNLFYPFIIPIPGIIDDNVSRNYTLDEPLQILLLLVIATVVVRRILVWTAITSSYSSYPSAMIKVIISYITNIIIISAITIIQNEIGYNDCFVHQFRVFHGRGRFIIQLIGIVFDCKSSFFPILIVRLHYSPIVHIIFSPPFHSHYFRLFRSFLLFLILNHHAAD